MGAMSKLDTMTKVTMALWVCGWLMVLHSLSFGAHSPEGSWAAHWILTLEEMKRATP